MKRTIVYVDGYNLCYRLLRGTGDKWLDLYAFAKGLLNDDHDIIEVKYFTSMVVPYPCDAAAIERQNVYLQAVAANPKVRVTLGYYSKKPTVLPARSSKCRSCEVSTNGLVRVFKFEEKRSDVNMMSQPLFLSASHSRPRRRCFVSDCAFQSKAEPYPPSEGQSRQSNHDK